MLTTIKSDLVKRVKKKYRSDEELIDILNQKTRKFHYDLQKYASDLTHSFENDV